jgi:hypothetical protein
VAYNGCVDRRGKLERQADAKAMDQRSAYQVYRSRQRWKMVLWLLVIAAAVRFVPWRSLITKALGHAGVEVVDSDSAGN